MKKVLSLLIVFLAFGCGNEKTETSVLMGNGTKANFLVCNHESQTLYMALAIGIDTPTATAQGWRTISPGGCANLNSWDWISVIKQAFYIQSPQGRYIPKKGEWTQNNETLVCLPNGITLSQDFSASYDALKAFQNGYCPGTMIKQYITTLGSADVTVDGEDTYDYKWTLAGGRFIETDRLVSTQQTSPTREELREKITRLRNQLENLKDKAAECDARVQSLISSGKILGTPSSKIDDLKILCNFDDAEHSDLKKKFHEAKRIAKESLSSILIFLKSFYDKLAALGPRVKVVSPYEDDYETAGVSNLVRPKVDTDLASNPAGFFTRIGMNYKEIVGGYYGQYTDKFVSSALAFTSTFHSYGSEMLPGEDMDQDRFLEYKDSVESMEEYFNGLDYEKDRYGYPLGSPVPDEIKLIVRNDIKPNAGAAGVDLENALKQWEGALTEKQRNILEAVRYLGIAFHQTVLNLPRELAEISKRLASITEGAVQAVKEASKCAAKVGSAGDFGDWYEIIHGKDICTHDDITIPGRAFSAAGLVIGSAKFWRGMGELAGVAVHTKRVFKEAEHITEEVIDVIGHTEFKRILSFPYGSRPDPKTYLPESYIKNHLAKFEGGASYLVPQDFLDTFGRELLGRPSGQFISTVSDIDNVLAMAKGDISIIEKELGIYPPGSWAINPSTGKPRKIVRIDIKDPKNLKLRIPTGNEVSANPKWLPGGILPNGRAEAVVNQILAGQYIETVVVQ